MRPPELTSKSTHQITGRGTIKVIDPATMPEGYAVRVGDPVRVDGQDWICSGVEMYGLRRRSDDVGILVRSVSSANASPGQPADTPALRK